MEIEITEEARKLLSEEYSKGGAYPTYAKLALEGEGAFTMCSLRAIQRALDKQVEAPDE